MNHNKNHISDLFSTNYDTSLTIPKTSTFETNKIETTTIINRNQIPMNQDHYKNFISELITKTYHTHGYIQSCKQGTKNQSLLFYNIGGDVRFCERLQRHHKSHQM
jgi:hypothetical protein